MLSPELEHGDPSHRLCLHYRDFPHNAYVADSIVSAVTSSRRTILVLSKNFLVHEWSRFEVKSALHDVLKSGGQRTIILLVGEVSPRDLDPDLRLAVKANPTIHWSDRMFWEKLRSVPCFVVDFFKAFVCFWMRQVLPNKLKNIMSTCPFVDAQMRNH